MDIQTIPDWLWVKNTIYVDFGQQETNALKFAKIQLWDGSTMLIEGLYVAKNDYLKVDIAGFASKSFELIPNITTASETFKNLTIVILINETDTEIYNASHTFIFGGKEITDLFSIDTFTTGTSLSFLTEFEQPTIWQDYPFELCFAKDGVNEGMEALSVITYDQFGMPIGNTGVSFDSTGERQILKINPLLSGVAGLSEAEYLTVEGNINETKRCNFQREYIPNGVYLRWINRLGGIDQYYFFKKDTKRPIKTTSVPLPQSMEFTDTWNKGVGKVVDKEKLTTITIGAYQVPINDYSVIARISESERVDMYVSGNWIQILVNDSDWNIAHENDYQDIEFSITTI